MPQHKIWGTFASDFVPAAEFAAIETIFFGSAVQPPRCLRLWALFSLLLCNVNRDWQIADRSMSVPLTSSDHERWGARGHSQADLRIVRPTRNKFGRTHVGRDPATPLHLHKCVARFVNDSWPLGYLISLFCIKEPTCLLLWSNYSARLAQLGDDKFRVCYI